MASEFIAANEELISRLPLPLAQLYRRAVNAKTPSERHLTAFYLWEAALKLLASVAVVSAAERTDIDPAVAERLQNLARPALGHWWEFVRLLVPMLADAGDRGFGQVRDLLLGRARDDLPRAAGLDAALREVLGGRGPARITVRLGELFDALAAYRNRELGHGAAGQRGVTYYDRTGPALLAGVAEILGQLDVLAGRRLIHVSDVRRLGSGNWLVERYELIGESGRRLESLKLPDVAGANLPVPDRLYLAANDSAGELGPLLHPLVLYEADAAKVFFLYSRRREQQADYLCYTSGEVMRRDELGHDQRELIGRVLTRPAEAQPATSWGAISGVDEPSRPAAEPPPSRRVGDFELLSKLGQGGMGVVYRAWQPSLGREVALKCLLHGGDARVEARFAREIRACARVEHPHLVRVYATGTDGDRLFLAMELLEGTELATVYDQLAGGDVSSITADSWMAAVRAAGQAQAAGASAERRRAGREEAGSASAAVRREDSAATGRKPLDRGGRDHPSGGGGR